MTAALLAMPLPRGDAAEPCLVDRLLVNACRAWFGGAPFAYPQVSWDRIDQDLYFEERTGRQMDMLHSYHNVGDDQLSAADRFFATREHTLLLTNWALTTTWADADGSDPDTNARIDAMAQSIKELGDTRILLALHHEPEDGVTTTDSCPGLTVRGSMGTAAEYRSMWRTVRARFDAAGVDNVVWVMNYMNYAPYLCMVDELYPGDDLVDWVVFNAYQHGDTDVDFAANVAPMYDHLTTHSGPGRDYLGKPWGIVEWGINNSTQDNAKAYYAQATAAVESNAFPKLKLFLVFDTKNWTTGDGSYRVAYGTDDVYDQSEQDAFNGFAQSPALLGGWEYAPEEPALDTTAPTAPAWLTATREAPRRVRLRWGAAQDDTAVTDYLVSQDGRRIAVLGPERRSLTVSGLARRRGYAFEVRARDAAGNVGLAAEARVPRWGRR